MRQSEQILHALTNVGDDLVDMGEKLTFTKSPWRKVFQTVACLVLLIGFGAAAWQLVRPRTAEPIVQPAAETVLFPDELSTVSVGCSGRAENVRLACEAIDGVVVEPGEIFSFNETVGEPTAEKGYVPSPEYIGVDGEEVLGGGLNLAASALYGAALYAGLEIVEREPTVYNVAPTPLVINTAVVWDSVDFSFRNSLDHAVQIQAQAPEDGAETIRLSIWGVKEDENTVTVHTEVLDTKPYDTVERLDAAKPAGYRELIQTPCEGCVTVTYRTILDPAGNEILTEQVDRSVYQKRDAIYVVGPAAEPEAHATAAQVGSGPLSQAVDLPEADAEVLAGLLETRDWRAGTSDCLDDVVLTVNGRTVYYHSDCGTVNDYENEQSLRLSDEQRQTLNALLINNGILPTVCK